MADWINWLVAAGVLVVLELFTGTFYLLMMAIGLGFGEVRNQGEQVLAGARRQRLEFGETAV